MKRGGYIVFLFFTINFYYGQTNKNISFRILNKSIRENQYLTIKIKNKSKKDYTIFIDTTLWFNQKFYDIISTPHFVIYNEKKEVLPIMTDIKEHKESSSNNLSFNDSIIDHTNNELQVLKIKANSVTTIRKMIFLEKKDAWGNATYYFLKKGQKYFLQVQYSCTSRFLDYYEAVNYKKKSSVLKKELEEIYVGQIVSNIIPIEYIE